MYIVLKPYTLNPLTVMIHWQSFGLQLRNHPMPEVPADPNFKEHLIKAGGGVGGLGFKGALPRPRLGVWAPNLGPYAF